MKVLYFVFGIICGGVLIFIVMRRGDLLKSGLTTKKKIRSISWTWPDSLDALKAAPKSHKILFENGQVRILEVILGPHQFEPLHTHRFPSVMFGPQNDTSQFDIIYYPYAYDSKHHRYYATDSIRQHQGGAIVDSARSDLMKPEGPHRIKNLSSVTIDVFRVELKSNGMK